MPSTILFVDDEPMIIRSLRRMMHGQQKPWKILSAENGRAALDILNQTTVDMIVTDIRMPGMNGIELLNSVRHHSPNTIRFILSGHLDQHLNIQAALVAHQFLAKPCRIEVLSECIERALCLQELLREKRLIQVATSLRELPSLPELYRQLEQEILSSNPSLKKVGDVVARDITMTARMLQFINSAFFGLPHRISDPHQAVSLLGLEILKALILNEKIFLSFDSDAVNHGFSVLKFQQHSLTTGRMAREIAHLENTGPIPKDSFFTAGLLHNIGKLLLMKIPETFQTLTAHYRQNQNPDYEIEYEQLGTSHAELGGYLIGLWGLPHSIVEAITFHHRPSCFPHRTFCPLTAVHAAIHLQQELYPGGLDARTHLDQTYLDSLGLTERLPAWRSACALIFKEATPSTRRSGRNG